MRRCLDTVIEIYVNVKIMHTTIATISVWICVFK